MPERLIVCCGGSSHPRGASDALRSFSADGGGSVACSLNNAKSQHLRTSYWRLERGQRRRAGFPTLRGTCASPMLHWAETWARGHCSFDVRFRTACWIGSRPFWQGTGMTQRRLLTDEEQQALFAIPLGPDGMARRFTLFRADRELVAARCGDANHSEVNPEFGERAARGSGGNGTESSIGRGAALSLSRSIRSAGIDHAA